MTWKTQRQAKLDAERERYKFKKGRQREIDRKIDK
jgi:hypothetical protein